MVETEIFEKISDYSAEYAEFACVWIEKGIDDIKVDPLLPVSEVQKNLFYYLSEHYDEFIQEMTPEVFLKIERESYEKWLNDNDDNQDENPEFNSWLKDENDFLISNKDEIICIAVTILYKFLIQSDC